MKPVRMYVLPTGKKYCANLYSTKIWLMEWKKLPLEVQRLVFEFDNTYITHYQHCMNELYFLQTTYPVNVEAICDNYVPYYRRFTPVSDMANLNHFILSYCNRKKTLRKSSVQKTRCASYDHSF